MSLSHAVAVLLGFARSRLGQLMTGAVLALGVALLVGASASADTITRSPDVTIDPDQTVTVSFTVTESDGGPDYCRDDSTTLNAGGVITGAASVTGIAPVGVFQFGGRTQWVGTRPCAMTMTWSLAVTGGQAGNTVIDLTNLSQFRGNANTALFGANSSITVTVRNVAPVVSPDPITATTAEDTPVEIAIPATDANGDTLAYVPTDPVRGTVTGTGPTFTYTPDPNYNGPDTFDVTVSDGELETTSTLTVEVTPVEDPVVPTLDPTVLVIDEDTSGLTRLIVSDPDGRGSVISITTWPAHGSIYLTPNPTTDQLAYVYTPAPDYFGSDRFTITAVPVLGEPDRISATVEITINPVPDAPVIDDATAGNRTIEATSSAGAVLTPGVTATDVDGTTPTVTCNPAAGAPLPRGTTTVTCVASDGLLTDTATFTVRVVDTTGPVITLIGGPQPNATYTRSTLPAAPICDTSDSASVVTQCTITGYSTAVGRHTMTIRARDTAGNATVVTRSYTVVAGGSQSTPTPTRTPTNTPPTATPTTPVVTPPTSTPPTATPTTRPGRTPTTTPAPTRPPRP